VHFEFPVGEAVCEDRSEIIGGGNLCFGEREMAGQQQPVDDLGSRHSSGSGGGPE